MTDRRPRPPNAATEPRLVIAEDDSVQQRAYSAIGARYGFQIAFATRTTDVLRLVLAERPDAIVLDLNLEDGNSLKVLRCLRESPETANTPIAVISANLVPEITAYLEGLGNVHMLAKPWLLDDLVALVSEMTATRAAPPASVTLPSRGSPTPS